MPKDHQRRNIKDPPRSTENPTKETQKTTEEEKPKND